MDKQDEDKTVKVAKLPVAMSHGLEIICHGIIKNKDGFFRTEKEKKSVFDQINEAAGKEEFLPNRLVEKIGESRIETDRYVAFNCRKGKGKLYKIWYYAFIIDDCGVRISFKYSVYWKKMRSVHAPFDRKKYQDNAFRRREINAGLDEPDVEQAFLLEKKFERKEECDR